MRPIPPLGSPQPKQTRRGHGPIFRPLAVTSESKQTHWRYIRDIYYCICLLCLLMHAILPCTMNNNKITQYITTQWIH
jgi:hypothetical protein